VYAAVPLFSVAVPIAVDPILNVTVPVGVPLLDVTVAENVTACPTTDGFNDEEIVVVVGWSDMTC